MDSTTFIVVEFDKKVSWQKFIDDHFNAPPVSFIALDGYVEDPPGKHITESGAELENCDHHIGVNRALAPISAQKVRDRNLIKKIQINLFRKITVFKINDSDQDVVMGILSNYFWKFVDFQENINRFLHIWSDQDRFGGFSGPPSGISEAEYISEVRKQNYIFNSLNEFRAKLRENKIPSHRVNKEFMKALNEVKKCFAQYLQNPQSCPELEFNGNYELLGEFKCNQTSSPIAFVQNEAQNARNKMYLKGYRAFLSFMGNKNNGKYIYSLGKRPDKDLKNLKFDLDNLFFWLNVAEKLNRNEQILYNLKGEIVLDNEDKVWAGSDLIGGCRNRGSSFNPDEIWPVLESIVKATNNNASYKEALSIIKSEVKAIKWLKLRDLILKSFSVT